MGASSKSSNGTETTRFSIIINSLYKGRGFWGYEKKPDTFICASGFDLPYYGVLVGYLRVLDGGMAGVGIEHDDYLSCFLIHAVVFTKGVHHPFPEGFGVAGIYAVA